MDDHTAAAQSAPLPTRDEEGYLTDPERWDEAVALAIARELGVELGEAHWAVIAFMRSWLADHGVTPDARHVMRHLEALHGGNGRQRLFELFPYGYVAQACRIAGMRRPRAWSTG
ncbi:MAG TPA: TusE/DsrC/DsvC family sulfur relay protein [Burkholderiaceae bacterium]|nr:TusE/DsrC/DsvC family sulfur relay protein [Burkholderiaceae bacterium]HMX11064.1 TusE/DsrC/DsvC family sulfur relay protein [Burkholderiaceae bacterium]HMZ02148.1 TusE/DsrC/DsvC family sulfur relay protein [Burkholderiaceae bacterium]HNB45586.1 TusE/DsrC/DsvC family sulfur relay protein [Burkholderiaceae bacterium]HNG82843.1 TusE/DsrC/DsvC family sulfur relay protein [Burkholderiaceae bacterium]